MFVFCPSAGLIYAQQELVKISFEIMKNDNYWCRLTFCGQMVRTKQNIDTQQHLTIRIV